MKCVAYFSAPREGLFFLHVYHAFHHVYTSKKPPSRRQISKIPLKNTCKTAKPRLDRGFEFFSQKQFSLLGFPESFVFVGLLQNKKCLFLDALFGDKTFAVKVVLQSRIDAAGRP